LIEKGEIIETIALEKIKKISVLYVEDEKYIREKVADTLKYYVKNIYVSKDGQEGYKTYQEKSPDVILCDIMMPITNGIEMIKRIREIDSKTPVVMITAHTDKKYLLDAVKLHLENYIVKPVTLKDLLNALSLCVNKIHQMNSEIYSLLNGYRFDLDHKVLTYKDESIKLNKKEYMFLELLYKNRHRVVYYEELQENVWGDSVMTDNAIRSVVSSLRKKLPKNLIINLSGIGYRLDYDI